MSMDTADDLEYAENLISLLATTAERVLLESDVDLDTDAVKTLLAAIQGYKEYCRPMCGAEGEPTSDECGDDDCACLCGHTEYEEETFLEDTDEGAS